MASVDPIVPRLGETTPAEGWDGVERRSGIDRREQQRRWGDIFRFRQRKNAGRRATDRQDAYVDAYTINDAWMLLAIFALNIADAFFTLHWLGRGGAEGNPVMQFFLDLGTEAFLFQKIAVAGFWLVLLTAHKNFRMARLGMWGLLVVYGCLFLYHLVLFFLAEPLPAPPPGAEWV